eukprot:g8975.t1
MGGAQWNPPRPEALSLFYLGALLLPTEVFDVVLDFLLPDEQAYYPPKKAPNGVAEMAKLPPQQLKHVLQKAAEGGRLAPWEKQFVEMYTMSQVQVDEMDRAYEKDPWAPDPGGLMGGLLGGFGGGGPMDGGLFCFDGLRKLRRQDWRFREEPTRRDPDPFPPRNKKLWEKQAHYEMKRVFFLAQIWGDETERKHRVAGAKACGLLRLINGWQEEKRSGQDEASADMPESGGGDERGPAQARPLPEVQQRFLAALRKVRDGTETEIAEQMAEAKEGLGRNVFEEGRAFLAGDDPKSKKKTKKRASSSSDEIDKEDPGQPFPEDIILASFLSARPSGFGGGTEEQDAKDEPADHLLRDAYGTFGTTEAAALQLPEDHPNVLVLKSRMRIAERIFHKCLDLFYLYDGPRMQGASEQAMGVRMACEYAWECYESLGVTSATQQKFSVHAARQGANCGGSPERVCYKLTFHDAGLPSKTGEKTTRATLGVNAKPSCGSGAEGEKDELHNQSAASKSTTASFSPPSRSGSTAEAEAPDKKNLCVACGKQSATPLNSFTCPVCGPACGKFFICDRDCQKSFWKVHKNDHSRKNAFTSTASPGASSSDTASAKTDNAGATRGNRFVCRRGTQYWHNPNFPYAPWQDLDEQIKVLRYNYSAEEMRVRMLQGRSAEEVHRDVEARTKAMDKRDPQWKKRLLQSPKHWFLQVDRYTRYEWLVDCYRMRSRDDLEHSDGTLWNGLYLPDVPPYKSRYPDQELLFVARRDRGLPERTLKVRINQDRALLAKEFLKFSKLCVRHGCLFEGFSWRHFLLEVASPLLVFPFCKADAIEKYGEENVYSLTTASLRRQACWVYGCGTVEAARGEIGREEEKVDEECCAALDAQDFAKSDWRVFKEVGGRKLWLQFWRSLCGRKVAHVN